MFSLKTADRWSCGYSFSMQIDFCIWVLESDGLHVSPFDLHQDGDGKLRARGLDAVSWRSWVKNIVSLEQETRIAELQGRDADEFFFKFTHPSSVWQGEPAIEDLLTELWLRYLSVSGLREEHANFTKSLNGLEEANVLGKVWRDLKPYHKRISGIHIYLVDYSWAVQDILPPTSAIQGVGIDFNASTFRTTMLRAAERLTTASASQ